MDEKGAGQSQPEEYQWLEKVFCNSIMLKKILIYLSLDDIKILRSTTLELNHEVLSCKRFKNNALFKVCDDSVQSGVLNHCGIRWKNVKIELYDGIGSNGDDKKKIRDLLDNHVEYLNLTGDKENQICFLDMSYNSERKCPLVMDKIDNSISFKSLTTLHIHSYILNGVKIRESPFLTDSLFKNLKRLTLYYESTLKMYNPVRETDNLAYISENCKSLVEFSIDRIVESHIDGSLTAKKSIIDILTSNAAALTSVCLDDESIWNVKEISEINFPVLKHCGIRCTVANESHALIFLKNLNQDIESLSVVFKGYLPIPILKAIRDKSKGLKKLRLKAFQLGDNNSNEDIDKVQNLWIFLQEMEHLDDFSLTEPHNSQYNAGLWKYQNLLRNLPKQVQKIRLRGMYSDEVEKSIFPSLSFDNLTVLNLLRCNSSLNDGDLQYICSKMTKLVELMFSHADFLTDAGVTGISINESGETVDSGMSIRNLKGLKVFTMRYCYQITTAIFESIVFKFLTDLNLGNNITLNITDANAVEIAEEVINQNPLLKQIQFSHCAGLTVDLLQKKFIDYSRGRCALDVVANDWPSCDSDIDAEDELEYHNDHDSDFSGGGYGAQDEDDFGFSDQDDEDGYDF